MLDVFVYGILFGAFAGLVTPLVVRGAKQAFPSNEPKRLPRSGNVPEDRAEAVRRVLKHLQRRSIADLQEGSAAVIIGTVKAIEGVATLRSPVTNTECLGFHIDVRGRDLDLTLRYPQLHEIARIVEIEVTDETGTIRVSSEGLELAITDGAIRLWDPPLPPELQALVPHPQPVSVEEGLLHPGARILVCGVAVRELGATDYRDGASKLVMRATQTFPLVASTDPDLLVAGRRPIAAEELYRSGKI